MTGEQLAEATPDDTVAPVSRHRFRRRAVLLPVGIALAIGAVAACAYGGGYALVRGDGLPGDDGVAPPPPAATGRAVPAVPSASPVRLDRFGDGSDPDSLRDATMTVTGGFAIGGRRARWGYLTNCAAGACGGQGQQQQYVDVNLHFDADVTLTARFGIVDGGTPDKPVRFEVIADPNEEPDGVVYDRTLAAGRSDDVSVRVSGRQLRFLVTGPLAEVTAGILDPTVS